MKLTREQVSQLSDKDLNFHIFKSQFDTADRDMMRYFQAGKINYLTDYNLTIPLAIKQELEVDFNKNSTIVFDFMSNIRLELGSQNPLRAICEVLLMIAMEREA